VCLWCQDTACFTFKSYAVCGWQIILGANRAMCHLHCENCQTREFGIDCLHPHVIEVGTLGAPVCSFLLGQRIVSHGIHGLVNEGIGIEGLKSEWRCQNVRKCGRTGSVAAAIDVVHAHHHQPFLVAPSRCLFATSLPCRLLGVVKSDLCQIMWLQAAVSYNFAPRQDLSYSRVS
jgi:hypothetical protein